MGVGAALLSGALDKLRRDRWEEAILWVFDENTRARSFYNKFGFEADGAAKRDEDGPVKFEGGPLQVRFRLKVNGEAKALDRPLAVLAGRTLRVGR